ncbi:NVEALA domain-containing protein [Phocaeicola dorei]|jgi:hypothetical protein|uniref:NVEALA domain-containing protein n=1 Tax=Phocaeicola dorei TaxID=357276 RepID=UPI000E4842BA|nr:NVEALA domain-containing protein [Phocaeicola dorei]RGX66655.1 hypothetical protein DXA69_23345 [Phocaeicola dorei]
MKGKILKVTIVAAFALIAGFNVYNVQKSDVMSDLALANVEALAGGEGSGGGCHYRITYQCGIVDSTVPWRPTLNTQKDATIYN